MSKASEKMSENASKLLELARKRFGELNEAEEELFRSVGDGKVADYRSKKEEDNDPAKAGEWKRKRVLDADRIVWLCTNPEASAKVTHKGIRINGARIDKELDLSDARIPYSLSFEKCAFSGEINLQHAEIFVLDIKGTRTGQIDAYGLRVAHDLYLRDGFEAKGQVYLSGSIIGGTLHCDKGQFINSEGIALRADRMKVEGSVYLRDGFKAKGEVYLRGATIGEALHCDEGQFLNENKGGVVLRADRLKVGGNVFMRQGFMAEGEVNLTGATIGGTLNCDNGQFINNKAKALIADSANIKGNVFLREGFKAEGEVSLGGATIGGNLDCSKGQFINEEATALNANGANIKGNVFLRERFKAKGEVRLRGATIDGALQCDGSKFINPKGYALNVNSANIKGNVFLRYGFKAEGEVRLQGATIGGTFWCDRGKFFNANGSALRADRLKVEGAVFLRTRFRAEGEVCLRDATIGGELHCDDGKFIKADGVALCGDRMKVGGGVFLHKHFEAKGEVSLEAANISGQLDCTNGRFINKGATAFSAGGAKIGGDIYLCNGFKSEGKVRLYGATIGGSLDCRSGQFINKDSEAIIADGLNVNGSIFLNEGFEAEGQVRLYGATVRVNLDCIRGGFTNKNAEALIADRLDVKGNVFLCDGFKAEGEVNLIGATINGSFQWWDVNSSEGVILDLRSARIGVLFDDKDSWPDPGKLLLHGLVYNEIYEEAPRDAKRRIGWLRRQKDFSPHPYEQVSVVLRKGGQDEDARKILIAKNQDKARLTKLTWSEWLWYRLFGPIIGYGYRPWRALGIGLVIVLIGWLFFWAGDEVEIMTSTKEGAAVSGSTSGKINISPDYPPFCALVYSLDVFLPVVDLHQSSYWLPNTNRDGELTVREYKIPVYGKILRYYLWFEIIAGWILTSLFVVGLTGLVRT